MGGEQTSSQEASRQQKMTAYIRKQRSTTELPSVLTKPLLAGWAKANHLISLIFKVLFNKKWVMIIGFWWHCYMGNCCCTKASHTLKQCTKTPSILGIICN
jgi:hypothetical protein